MKKRIQFIQHQVNTTLANDEQLDLILQHARAIVPNTPPPPDQFRPTFSYYLHTAEGRLIVFIAFIALGIAVIPSILARSVTIADIIRLSIAAIVIMAGVFAIPARHTASLAILRLSALVLTCAAIAAPFILPVLDQPAKIAVLWPALTGLFITISLTTAYLISIPIRHARRPLSTA